MLVSNDDERRNEHGIRTFCPLDVSLLASTFRLPKIADDGEDKRTEKSQKLSNKSIKWKIGGNNFMWVDSSYVCAKFGSFQFL